MNISKFLIFIFFCFSLRSENYLLIDDETETFLNEIVEKIKSALKFKQEINIYVLDDQSINAAALEDGNILINSGAIVRIDNHEELIAILAHEIGHVEGGHIISYISNSGDFLKAGLVTTLIGAIASICAKDSSPLIAGTISGQAMSTNMALTKIQQKENIADTKAVEAVKTLKWPVLNGFVSLHKKMSEHSTEYGGYISTHPQSKDRVLKFEEHARKLKGQKTPKHVLDLMKEYEKKFKRIKHKLTALTSPIQLLSDLYKNPKNSDEEYARAIALYRTNKNEEAIKLIDKLTDKCGEDQAYYTEIKAMCLINMGECDKAADVSWDILKNDKKNKVHRDLGLIYALATISKNIKKHVASAIKVLKKILIIHKNDVSAKSMLGNLYAISGDLEKASLCAAEIALNNGDFSTAKFHAKKAINCNDPITKRKANDIILLADEQKKDSENPF
ncbi:MAG: M48 family metalloprotease [Holosporales bacterium]|jgi:predicted Zn-dependent protease|nr:M48 family metalloprotease [Holosporales bacterium]